MPKYAKKLYRKRKRYAKRFFKRKINRPKYDSSIKITCDTELPLRWSFIQQGSNPAYPDANRELHFCVHHALAGLIQNVPGTLYQADLSITREWGMFANPARPYYNFYKVTGVKMQLVPFEVELGTADISFFGGHSASTI